MMKCLVKIFASDQNCKISKFLLIVAFARERSLFFLLFFLLSRLTLSSAKWLLSTHWRDEQSLDIPNILFWEWNSLLCSCARRCLKINTVCSALTSSLPISCRSSSIRRATARNVAGKTYLSLVPSSLVISIRATLNVSPPTNSSCFVSLRRKSPKNSSRDNCHDGSR